MEIPIKEEWENFMVEQLRGQLVKEFGKLKTDGERFKYCKNILRNSPTGQGIVEFIKKLLSSKAYNGKSFRDVHVHCSVAEEHVKRRDYKKAVICFSMAIQQALQPWCNTQSSCWDGPICESSSSNSADNIGRTDSPYDIGSLYASRAEALFEAGEYKACLSDIQEAMVQPCSQAVSGKLLFLQKSCLKKLELTNQYHHGVGAENHAPNVTGGLHSKIANGSRLIEINCSSSQGRFLQASDDIRAGDTLISEAPYAAVLLPENAHSHCDYCFQNLVAPFPCQQNCEVLYCSPSCRNKAWLRYHKVECSLMPLLNVVDTLFRLSLRILLVTGIENIIDFLKELSVSCDMENKNPNKVSGCTPDGEYLGDYSSVFSLVTNTELQPVKTLMSHALNSALLSEFLQETMAKADDLQQRPQDCKNCVNNWLCQSHKLQDDKLAQFDSCAQLRNLLPRETCASLFHELNKSKENQARLYSLPGDVIGCLLYHHSQQMACNVHAITSITSTGVRGSEVRIPTANVVSRQQKRIASAVYPTASLLNHACDPDVIVSFVNGHLVVRATHNISKGSEISHSYGPHVSRMSREDRQKLLYKQYFFTCQCAACKSDEEMENKRLCFSAFACPKCKHPMKLANIDESVVGRCQNRECNLEKSMLEECRLAYEAELLFGKGNRLLERVGVKEALDVFHECLRRRRGLLHKYHKDLAETHDAIARCYAMINDYKAASHFCTQSSEAVEKAFGSTSVEYAHELHKLSQLLFNGRQVKKALSTIDKAASLLTRHYGRKNPDVRELSEMKRCLVGYARTSSPY